MVEWETASWPHQMRRATKPRAGGSYHAGGHTQAPAHLSPRLIYASCRGDDQRTPPFTKANTATSPPLSFAHPHSFLPLFLAWYNQKLSK